MASGMGVNPTVKEEFTKMKLKKTAKIMTFKIGGTEIVVDKSLPTGTVEDLKKCLPDKECRYACYDADKKIHFILWTPDTSTVKDKMTYSSSKDALHKQLEGVTPVAFSAHDKADFDDLLKA